jgi:hypothetical protein
MNRIVQRICDIGALAWLRFVQALNAIAVALFVNQVYPGVIANAVNKLPPALGIPLILAFGVVVHYAIKRAKTAA